MKILTRDQHTAFVMGKKAATARLMQGEETEEGAQENGLDDHEVAVKTPNRVGNSLITHVASPKKALLQTITEEGECETGVEGDDEMRTDQIAIGMAQMQRYHLLVCLERITVRSPSGIYIE